MKKRLMFSLMMWCGLSQLACAGNPNWIVYFENNSPYVATVASDSGKENQIHDGNTWKSMHGNAFSIQPGKNLDVRNFPLPWLIDNTKITIVVNGVRYRVYEDCCQKPSLEPFGVILGPKTTWSNKIGHNWELKIVIDSNGVPALRYLKGDTPDPNFYIYYAD